MTKPLKSNATSTYVQLEPGTEPYYIGDCVSVDAIPNPRGSTSLIQCIGPYGRYVSLGDKQDPPGTIDFSMENLLFRAASWLEDIDCPFTIYAMQGCGKRGVFSDWLRGVSVEGCRLTDDPMSNVAQRTAQDEILHTHEISGWPPRHDYRLMTTSRIPTAETMTLNSLDSQSDLRCGDDCGEQQSYGDILVACANATGAATANVIRSVNAGATWAATAADPFAGVNDHAMSVRCFSMDSAITRILCLRTNIAGAAYQASYSDDNGAVWTTSAVGTTVNEGAVGDQSLMALDDSHLWAASNLGRVFKSTDGGVTWVDQTTALAASGASSLNAIHFADENVGFAGGAGGVVIKTLDGGDNWAAVTVPVAAVINTIWVHSQYRVLVGTATGLIYQTWDGGVTWTAMNNFTGAGVGQVRNIKFMNNLDGFMVWQTAAPIFYIYRTVDGGYSWTRLANPSTFAGGSAVLPLRINRAIAVGAAQGGTAVIARANG